MQKRKGFTLIELMIVLAIVAILGLLSSNLSALIARNQKATSLGTLRSTLQLARSEAIKNNRRITVCGSNDNITCTKDWENSKLLVFYDQNNNKIFDANDLLYREIDSPKNVLHWRGSGGRAYMRYREDGSLIEWGRYTYCPSDSKDTTAVQIVLNKPGRPYFYEQPLSKIQALGLCS